MGTLKPHSNGPLYRNTVIGTLAVDGYAVTFGTARRGPAQSIHPSIRLLFAIPYVTAISYNHGNSPAISGQCTNFILFHMAL